MLRLYFIARDDLDDFLNLRQRWLWCVWRWTALLRLSKRWHRGESGDGEDKFEFHDRVPRLCAGPPGEGIIWRAASGAMIPATHKRPATRSSLQQTPGDWSIQKLNLIPPNGPTFRLKKGGKSHDHVSGSIRISGFRIVYYCLGRNL
jgi:hypothetical protein